MADPIPTPAAAPSPSDQPDFTEVDDQLDRAKRSVNSDQEQAPNQVPQLDPATLQAVLKAFGQIGDHLAATVKDLRALKATSEQTVKAYDNPAIVMAIDTFLPEIGAMLDFLLQTQNDVDTAATNLGESQGQPTDEAAPAPEVAPTE